MPSSSSLLLQQLRFKRNRFSRLQLFFPSSTAAAVEEIDSAALFLILLQQLLFKKSMAFPFFSNGCWVENSVSEALLPFLSNG
ncbi:hypothetical protein LINPERHAP2_LOCUS3133 [Linum perenne]